MNAPVRKTAEGVEISNNFLRLATTGMVLIGTLWVGAKLIVHKSDAIEAAVPRREFLDSTKAFRTDLTGVMARVDATSQRVDTASQQMLGLNCALNGYPTPFCDGVKRAPVARSR